MDNLRTYGNAPYRIAVLHGGPGAPGEMAPVARELSRDRGVLEPLQTADTLEGQVDELREVLESRAALPATLIGWSWGAWLGFILAARHPALVCKLILVGCPPFEQRFAAEIEATRMSRLSEAEKREADRTLKRLDDISGQSHQTSLARLGRLFAKTDSFHPLPVSDETIKLQFNIYRAVWRTAAEMRRSGDLLHLGEQIRCPVVAIHGDYDPHPAEGVQQPLETILGDFRFILLPKCGHAPWREKDARSKFYAVLSKELTE
ncbi:MAG: alpha/beta hydrolase [Chloroflexi bacterium RBG_13_60_9]|nr:MAG: alpha/beta hydrolase [Chloroflexi bacterium RBG_13_60_9]